jgi:hypothetical protein
MRCMSICRLMADRVNGSNQRFTFTEQRVEPVAAGMAVSVQCPAGRGDASSSGGPSGLICAHATHDEVPPTLACKRNLRPGLFFFCHGGLHAFKIVDHDTSRQFFAQLVFIFFEIHFLKIRQSKHELGAYHVFG